MDRPDISVKCGWRGIGLAQIWMITLGVIFLLFRTAGGPIQKGHASAQMMQTLDLTKILLRYVALYCVLDGLNLVAVGALQGAGDTRWTMVVSVIIHSGFIALMWFMDIRHAGLHLFWSVATGFVMVSALGMAEPFRVRQMEDDERIESSP